MDAEGCHSIGEQMIPFTGQSSLKQYIKSKPKNGDTKYGFAPGSQAMYMTEFYQRAGNRPDKVLGLSADVVVRLSQSLAGKCHKVYFDNLFTTLPLLKHLREEKIYAVGTLRKNRLMGAESVLASDKDLKERGAASYATNEEDITIVKWNDNNFVHTASTFAGMQPVDTVKRWDKK